MLNLARVLAAAILAWGFAPAAAKTHPMLPVADDLAAVAEEVRQRRVPLMIVFTLESCPYCAVAKRDYLFPMQTSGNLRDKVIAREMEIDSRETLKDFDGRLTTQAEFAGRYAVKRVPTVIVVDDQGAVLSGPLVGLLAADFYGLYLERAIEEGLVKLRTKR